MIIADAQHEMRSVYLGGFAGQLIAAIIWALSAALSTWSKPIYGMAELFFGGMLLFPLTQLLLRAIGRSATLGTGNSMEQLAREIAFTVPINFLLVGAVTLFHVEWFYPAAMIVVGAHYLPFMYLYGMWQFGVLGALLIASGTAIALYAPGLFSVGGWLAALLFLVFAFVGRQAVLREERV